MTSWEALIRDRPAGEPYCPETDCAKSSQIMNVLTLEGMLARLYAFPGKGSTLGRKKAVNKMIRSSCSGFKIRSFSVVLLSSELQARI